MNANGNVLRPLVADLFLFCYERDLMKSLTKEKRYDMLDAFNLTSTGCPRKNETHF